MKKSKTTPIVYWPGKTKDGTVAEKVETAKKGKPGRKTRYNAKMHPRRATELVEQGMTDAELAEAFGIGETTLYRWQEQFREFRESIKGAKEKPNREVVAALHKRAIGYTYDSQEVTASGEKDEKGSSRVIKVVQKKIHIPADATSMIFWLKNRLPDEWRDVYRMQHVFNPEAGLEGITPEDEKEVAEAVEDILGHGGGNGDAGK